MGGAVAAVRGVEFKPSKEHHGSHFLVPEHMDEDACFAACADVAEELGLGFHAEDLFCQQATFDRIEALKKLREEKLR
jgi:hypothetical protein